MHAVVLGRVQDQRTPAAAHVEQPHARLQAELAADQLQLVPLGLGDAVAVPVVGRVGPEVGAGVGHVVVEQGRVELVALVVVVADRVAVAIGAVLLAGEHRLLARRSGTPSHDPEPQRRPRPARPVPPPRQGRGPGPDSRPDARQSLGQIALDVQLAGDVRAGEAQLVGVPQQAAHRGARPQDDDGRIGRPGLAAVPGADAHRDLAQHLADHLGQASGHGPGGGGGERGARRLLVVVVVDSVLGSSGVRIVALPWMRRPGRSAVAHGVCWPLFPPRPQVVARPPCDRRSADRGRPAQEDGSIDERLRSSLAPCALRRGVPRLRAPIRQCNGRWSPDRREEAHCPRRRRPR